MDSKRYAVHWIETVSHSAVIDAQSEQEAVEKFYKEKYQYDNSIAYFNPESFKIETIENEELENEYKNN